MTLFSIPVDAKRRRIEGRNSELDMEPLITTKLADWDLQLYKRKLMWSCESVCKRYRNGMLRTHSGISYWQAR
jgi:hypothetical protein